MSQDERRHVDIPTRPLLVAVNAGLVAVVAVQIARSRPAWEQVQASYATAVSEFEPGLQVVTPGTEAEMCPTCHPSAAGHPEAPGHPLHPDVVHQPTVMGCVACHGGDGACLLTHDEPRYGLDPPLSGEEAWLGCIHCHSPKDELGAWPTAVRVHEGVAVAMLDGGCLGCHRLRGRGAHLGADLGNLGLGRGADPHDPRETVRARVSRQLAPDRATPSLMPVTDLEPDEQRLLSAWLSTVGRAGGPDAWVPGDEPRTGEALFAAFCSGCHGREGEGREDVVGGVPGVGSRLFAMAAERDYLEAVIAEGRPGTLMVGFSPEEGERILTSDEVDLLVDLLDAGTLAPDEERYRVVAAASCEPCHPGRPPLYEELDDAARVVALEEHPTTLDIPAFARDEGLPWPPDFVQLADARATLDEVCGSCHADPARPDRRADAPVIRDYLALERFDDGFFLLNLVLGRSDAAPGRWRHQGVLDGQLTLDQMLALALVTRGSPP